MLLLHGLLMNAHVWDFFSLDMRQYFHVLSVDLRGHGDSSWAPDGDYTRARMTDDVVGLIEHLDLTSLILVGHSLGGAIAALVAQRIPERVRAVVMIDSTLLPTGRPAMTSQIQTDSATFASLEELARHAAPLTRRRGTPRVSLGLRWNARQLADGRWTWKYDPAILSQRRGRPALNFDEVWDAMRGYTGPLLFVRAADHSHLTDEAAHTLQAFGNVRLVVVPAAAHNVMSDNPLGFRREVSQFLSNIGALT
jgi:pimeloyl-ACP methyl ester carboxylesterase